MMTHMGTVVIPVGHLPEVKLGDELHLHLRVRVVKMEEELVDVSAYGSDLSVGRGSADVTMMVLGIGGSNDA